MESYKSSWNLTKAHGILLKLMESYKSSWNLIKAHDIIMDVMTWKSMLWTMKFIPSALKNKIFKSSMKFFLNVLF